jgi:hypothetical protein
MSMNTTAPVLGLLHTAESNRTRFVALLREMAPAGLRTLHEVHDDLLRDSLEGVPEIKQAASIEAALENLRAQGASQVLCTCSSIGRLAELAGARIGLPTLRVDRPMAEHAVAAGRRILMVACLPSTIAPTGDLLREVAQAAGRTIEIETLFLPSAWRMFERGEQARFAEAIAAAILDTPRTADALVLAQASMAPVADLLGAHPVPVFASPRLGLASALARLQDAQALAIDERRISA